MATQEIGLNEALEAEGIAAWETDLAELIVQLGDDLPCHILVPAIHRNRAEIREIFRRRMGDVGRPAPADLTDDPAVLAAAARAHLREKFLRAKVAVSGANFAVADTGTLVVVESEGNGRMCLTLPEVLVSVVGIEKVVATWADLDPMLRLLPRSSTGERMNPYTSTWSGVTPGDGPQEVHVVLLDNGRTRALADDVGRQALRCIRCSACLNVCPVYERVGGHAYGSVYPGPIGAILNPLLNGVADEQTASLPYASSLCGACFEVCPVRIDIPSVLVDLRAAGRRRAPRRPRAEARGGRDEGGGVDVLRLASAALGRARLRAGRSRPRPLLPYDAARRPHRRGPPARARRRMDRRARPARPADGVLPRVVGPHRRWTVRRRSGGGGHPTTFFASPAPLLRRTTPRGPRDQRPRRDPRACPLGPVRRVARGGPPSGPSGARPRRPGRAVRRARRGLPGGGHAVRPGRPGLGGRRGARVGVQRRTSRARPRRRRLGRGRRPGCGRARPHRRRRHPRPRRDRRDRHHRARPRARPGPPGDQPRAGPARLHRRRRRRSSPTYPTPSPCSTPPDPRPGSADRRPRATSSSTGSRASTAPARCTSSSSAEALRRAVRDAGSAPRRPV